MKRLCFCVVAAWASSVAAPSQAQELAGRLEEAHAAITRLDLTEARRLLADAPDQDPEVAVEKALLALYEGNCDEAVARLDRADVPREGQVTHVKEVARGCARVTAGTRTWTDEKTGISVRMKDDQDEPLLPLLVEVAEAGWAVLARELGVELPKPLRIELVRDHYSLAAMTGLPESSAQTTGTVAVAKWGRVTMLSPRAAPHGYSWADTLMHEMTHLAVTRASVDRAPLWLQEGVAKRQETRWRPAFVFDDSPPADALATLGFAKGLALPLDQLGPSIAMLPSATQASVVFGEVTSFVKYWVHESGDDALAQLLKGLGRSKGPVAEALNQTLVDVSGANLTGWNQRWRAYLARLQLAAREDDVFGGPVASPRDVLRRQRLGDLLAARGHADAALSYLEHAQSLQTRDPSLRAKLAKVYRTLGREEAADRLVDSLATVRSAHGVYLSLHGEALRRRGDETAAAEAFHRALWLSPLEPEVACEATSHSAQPPVGPPAALCEAAKGASHD